MKDKVLKIVKNALGVAEDNLYRANLQFGRMNEKQLSEKYGESGQTCGEILKEYQAQKAELERCINWVNSVV